MKRAFNTYILYAGDHCWPVLFLFFCLCNLILLLLLFHYKLYIVCTHYYGYCSALWFMANYQDMHVQERQWRNNQWELILHYEPWQRVYFVTVKHVNETTSTIKQINGMVGRQKKWNRKMIARTGRNQLMWYGPLIGRNVVSFGLSCLCVRVTAYLFSANTFDMSCVRFEIPQSQIHQFRLIVAVRKMKSRKIIGMCAFVTIS